MLYKITICLNGERAPSMDPELAFESEQKAQDHIDAFTEFGFNINTNGLSFEIVPITHTGLICACCANPLDFAERITIVCDGLLNMAGAVLIDSAVDSDGYYCKSCAESLIIAPPKTLSQPVKTVRGSIVVDCCCMPCRVCSPNSHYKSVCVMGGGCGESVIEMYGPIRGMAILSKAMDDYSTESDFWTLIEMAASDLEGGE